MPPVFLIADDSREKTAFLRAIVARALPTATIVEATTTEEALGALRRFPEILGAFVDYYIPSENGPAIIRALRAAHPDAGIALTSSSENPRNTTEAVAAGADAVVCTSTDAATLTTSLHALIDAWTAARKE